MAHLKQLVQSLRSLPRVAVHSSVIVRSFAAASTRDLHNAYQVLNVSSSMSLKDIKLKYYELALKYHPDVVSDDHSGLAEERFKNIATAMSTILEQHGDPADNDNVLKEFDPAYVFSFVGESLNKDLQADIAEVGATMSPAGPDRSGMFFMAKMMEQQRQHEEEQRQKQLKEKDRQISDH
eukprot:TRINITY_DN6069_c0_g1_i1.p1 TRINITY_DN6069_c0_g1~~TRINITY_DN6069_c0_g1_i1.p1  ORF type:complete len:180 (+),score=51.99 TRINITY_DN6069_c0_g1_i1:238-777(+)